MSKWLLFMTIALTLSLTGTASHGFSPQPQVITKQRLSVQMARLGRRVPPTPTPTPVPTATPVPQIQSHFRDHFMEPTAALYYLPGPQNLSVVQNAGLALQDWQNALNDPTVQSIPCTLQTQLITTATPPAQENRIVQGALGSNIVAATIINLGQGAMPELKRNWQGGYSSSPYQTFPVTDFTRGTIALSTSVAFMEKDHLSMTRFDLYRVLLHEMGHLLGLLDDALALSIMNGQLITQGPLSIDLTNGNKQLAGNHNCH